MKLHEHINEGPDSKKTMFTRPIEMYETKATSLRTHSWKCSH